MHIFRNSLTCVLGAHASCPSTPVTCRRRGGVDARAMCTGSAGLRPGGLSRSGSRDISGCAAKKTMG